MRYPDPAVRFWQVSQAIRRSAPLIHNITNLVVQNDTAAAISAVGATQVTLHHPEEARDAARASAALALNPGTLNDAWLCCAREALQVAAEDGKPWILDPVAAGLTRYRTDAARELLRLGPTVLKTNASELLVLAGQADAGRAADSIHSVDEASAAAMDLARRHGCVVVVTGAEDLLTDGEQVVRLGNGHAMMGRMIGSGCMLTSVIACFLAVSDPPFEAAQAAVACFTVAGEIAAENAGGPGTLKPLLVDALHALDGDELRRRLRIVPK